MFKTEQLQEMKRQIGELGFPTNSNTETTVFCNLVQANATLELANVIRETGKEIRDALKLATGQIGDSIDGGVDAIGKKLQNALDNVSNNICAEIENASYNMKH